MKVLFGLSALALTAALSTASVAATVDFSGAGSQGGGAYVEDGLIFDDVRVVQGNCTSASGPACAGLNKNETSILVSVTDDVFSLDSLWYGVEGKKSVLTITTDLGGLLVLGASMANTVIDFTNLFGFANVSSITFTASGGNVRFDDLNISMSAVPLPAAGLLLLGALGGLTVMRKRKMA